jgi:SET domain-containing protein
MSNFSIYNSDNNDNNTFIVKESNIKNAGNGVFYSGREILKKGEILFEYEGIVLGGKKERAFRSNRSFNLGNGYEIYGTGIASFINDGLEYFSTNCEFFTIINSSTGDIKFSEESSKKVFIRSTRDIYSNEELYIDYGNEFWKVHRKFIS